jgi:altronate hydrolase
MSDDMDVDAGRILEGSTTPDQVAQEIVDLMFAFGSGELSRSEALGHQEFVLGYESFEPIGHACR